MSRRATTLAICAALAVAVLGVYFQVLDHEFVEFDDGAYVVKNEIVRAGLTSEGLRWALTEFHSGNWHPLTWLSHMLDCEIFGLEAGRHAFVNVLLHAASAVLLFLALRFMTAALWPSALVAALFAIHPLRVESVAWVSERKDVLSGLFWILTLWAYAWYAKRTTPLRYLAVAGCLALGLASKSMLVTLPFVLLLLDAWPLGRWSPGDRSVKAVLPLVLEKLPLLALSAVVSVIVFLSQSSIGATEMVGRVPFGFRVANACVSYVAYLRDTVWPTGLACMYPHPGTYPGSMLQKLVIPGIVAGLLIVAITVVALYQLRRRPWLTVGWLWYLGTLVPVIGLLQIGAQGRADRYTYLPTIGIYMILAWGLADWLDRRHAPRNVVATVAVSVLVALAAVTWSQVKSWRNTGTLFERALNVTTDNYVIHNHLGNVYLFQQQPQQAVREYREAIRIKPDMAPAHKRLGFLFAGAGELDLARRHLGEAARITPENVPTRFALATVHVRRGETQAGIAELEATLRLEPTFAEGHSLLGVVLEQAGRTEEAIASFKRALELQPDLIQARQGLERILKNSEQVVAP